MGTGAKRESRAVNFVIGNNATAVAAAAEEARRLGYTVAVESATQCEGPAEEVGRRLAEKALKMGNEAGPTCRRPLNENDAGPKCFISGGEPVVKLVEPCRRGRGGRNQQLVLAALMRLAEDDPKDSALLSGGTDGEDGPTDAAGAFVDAEVLSSRASCRTRSGRLSRPQRRLQFLCPARGPDPLRPDRH